MPKKYPEIKEEFSCLHSASPSSIEKYSALHVDVPDSSRCFRSLRLLASMPDKRANHVDSTSDVNSVVSFLSPRTHTW